MSIFPVAGASFTGAKWPEEADSGRGWVGWDDGHASGHLVPPDGCHRGYEVLLVKLLTK